MRHTRVWAKGMGLAGAVVEKVELESETNTLVVSVRVGWPDRDRCGICRRRAPGFDLGRGRRRWRALDLGTAVTELEADSPRVSCPEHGVVVTWVPWARHGSRFTRAFEEQAAWLTAHAAQSTVATLLRVTRRSMARIVTRVVAAAEAGRDPFAHLERIGIDEISYRKGQKYITVVVDHDSGRLVWAAPGRDEATLHRFFDALGEQRCRRLRRVSRDGGSWIVNVVNQRCPQAIQCTDPFHVVKWATDALDEVRRAVWNQARRAGDVEVAHQLKGARWALWHNPENLTDRQQDTLEGLARANRPLYRAYLLKEALRLVFHVGKRRALAELQRWLLWARRSRLAPFVKLAHTITNYRASIEAALRYRLSNALVESTNQKIRLIIRRGFGFHSPEAIIALAKLSLGGLCPPLPGRS
ncbi:MAG: ISL3 family transposase [Candidatus Dormiibacterota bacterium]